MTVLVAYASKHGSTREIAARIAVRLNTAGVSVKTRPMKEVKGLDGYDAYILGSAVYFGSWMKEALSFARRYGDELSTKPLWFFSSGPLGTETVDAEGRDLREVTEPKELAELIDLLQPREHAVFFGALDAHDFGITERLIHALPAGKKLLAEGDFRDWDEIDAWADRIAQNLLKLVSVAG